MQTNYVVGNCNILHHQNYAMRAYPLPSPHIRCHLPISPATPPCRLPHPHILCQSHVPCYSTIQPHALSNSSLLAVCQSGLPAGGLKGGALPLATPLSHFVKKCCCCASAPLCARVVRVCMYIVHDQGRTQGVGLGARPSPWDLPSTRFSGFLPSNYIVCIFAACVRKIFAMWKDRASLLYGSGITLG